MKTENTVENVIKELVDAGQLAGAAALAWRNGEVVHAAAVGRRNLANELPVERDTIFRIASMTKPVTTVAALMLLDEGRFALDEPIEITAGATASMGISSFIMRKISWPGTRSASRHPLVEPTSMYSMKRRMCPLPLK